MLGIQSIINNINNKTVGDGQEIGIFFLPLYNDFPSLYVSATLGYNRYIHVRLFYVSLYVSIVIVFVRKNGGVCVYAQLVILRWNNFVYIYYM
jgi:hypothetical protein